jgi:diguanylate cyclase (GGDEF)-like protein/PAS domain S-box-containing protein
MKLSIQQAGLMQGLSFRVLIGISSVLLALIFVLLGLMSTQQAREEFDRVLELESSALRTTFEVSLSDMEQQMLLLATLVSSDRRVQTLFKQGREALFAEGGGAGGSEAAALREALYQYVAPAWIDMQQQFGLRQLHFQFGPGSLSYLRVHTPEKYGDRMDGLRHIIEDVNADQQARTGFETGRIYSGVRGVVPVWYEEGDDQAEFIGVLEAGTSFNAQLERFDRELGAGIAVLLAREHVEQAVWESFRGLNGSPVKQACGCYLEASSREEINDWMEALLLPRLVDGETAWQMLSWQGKHWHLTRFPLRDYRGKQDPERGHVGSVLIWRDKTELHALWQQGNSRMQISLLLAYLLAQGLLLWLLLVTRRGLQQRIKESTAALRESEAMLQSAQSVAQMGSWELDVASGRLSWSQETYRIFELDPDTPADYQLFLSFVHPEDRPAVDAAWQSALNGEPYNIEHRIVVNGKERWVRERADLVLGGDGELVSGIGTVQDITEAKKMEFELRRLATTDTLTGLPNRRYFIERMEQELERFHRYHKPVAVLMLDLDHFKQVNDRYGHAQGDAVLCHFAELVKDTLRKIDLVGRLGGEEFAILLPDTDAEGAELYAERLRGRVEESPCQGEQGSIPFTVSIGLTLFLEQDKGCDPPLARADGALYSAKEKGRNRVECHIG